MQGSEDHGTAFQVFRIAVEFIDDGIDNLLRNV
jgi:hypothetical protein